MLYIHYIFLWHVSAALYDRHQVVLQENKMKMCLAGWGLPLRTVNVVYHTTGESFWSRVLKISINFEEILSRAHGKFEGRNKVLESSTIIINYCIIILMHTIIL